MFNKIRNYFKKPRVSDGKYQLYLGRDTTDEDFFSGGAFSTVITQDENYDYKLQVITEVELRNKSATEILDILADSSPLLARGLYNRHLNIISEWTWTTEEDDDAGNEILDRAVQRIEYIGSSIPRKLGELVDAGYLKGAFFAENIFHNGEFQDIKIIDPYRAQHQKMRNDERGEFWQLVQRQNGEIVPLVSPYIRYVPLIPRTDKPYGRPMAGAALFPLIFTLGLLKAARQSMLLQAFPNRLITIDRKYLHDSGYDVDQIDGILTNLKKSLPNQIAATTTGTQFVQGREVAMELVGGVTRVSYDGLEMMIKILEKEIYAGLKEFPINFGNSEGSSLSSGNADQQDDLASLDNDAFMRQIESLMSIFGTQILNNYGNASTAVFQLKRNHSKPEKRRAERIETKVKVIEIAVNIGVITPEEARIIFRDPDSLNRLPEILKDDTEFLRLLDEQREMQQQAQEEEEAVDSDNEGDTEDANG